MTNHLVNAKQILDSYEANEELGEENLLQSATHALIAIAEQLEISNQNIYDAKAEAYNKGYVEGYESAHEEDK